VGAIEPWFWENLCKLLGREDFIEPQRAGPEIDQDRIEVFREIFLTKARDEWVDELMLKDTCVTPIYSLDEVAADPHFRERGSIVEAENLGPDAKAQVGMLFQMSKTPGSIRRAAPDTGGDTHDILRELGYGDGEIEGLAEKASSR
jgi:crotonobetainyl-CoA:carnitine CoA-transferase CaiB-like acyl-CoA transferase